MSPASSIKSMNRLSLFLSFPPDVNQQPLLFCSCCSWQTFGGRPQRPDCPRPPSHRPAKHRAGGAEGQRADPHRGGAAPAEGRAPEDAGEGYRHGAATR